MAEEKKAPPKKAPAKPEKAPKADKGDKSSKAAKTVAAKTEAAAAARGAVEAARPHGPVGRPRLAKHYDDAVRPALMQKFGYTSPMQAPRFVKIVLNMG